MAQWRGIRVQLWIISRFATDKPRPGAFHAIAIMLFRLTPVINPVVDVGGMLGQ